MFSAIPRRIQPLRPATSDDGRPNGLPPSDDVHVATRRRRLPLPLAFSRTIILTLRINGETFLAPSDARILLPLTLWSWHSPRTLTYVDSAIWVAGDGPDAVGIA